MSIVLMPNNLEAEQMLLGALLVDNRAFENITLKAEEFYAPVHQSIFEFMQDKIERGIVCDAGTISHAFDGTEALQELGGGKYIRSLTESVITIINAPHYANVIHDLFVRRQLITGCLELQEKAQDFMNTPDIMGEAERLLTGVSDTRQARTFTGAQASEAALEMMKDLRAKENTTVLKSGIENLDGWMEGFYPGELYIIGARPSMGKTALGLTIADNMSARAPVLFYSLEMGADALAMRLIASRSGVPISVQRSNKFLHPSQKTAIMEAHTDISTRKLIIEDTPALTLYDIKTTARRAKRKDGIQTIVVDHLGLVKANPKIQNKVHQLEEMTNGLKALAKELQIRVILLVQLSRSVENREDKKPGLHDLRDCLAADSLVTDADSGKRFTIQEITKNNLRFNVWSMNEKMKMVKRPILDAWETGNKNIYTIRTRMGRKIKCSEGHKFYTPRGWQELRNLKVDSSLGLPRKYSHPVIFEDKMTTEQATLLGWLIGDGYIGGTPAITVSSQEEVAYAIELGKAAFPELNPYSRKERDNTPAKRVVYTMGYKCGAGKNVLTNWLKSIEIWGKRGKNKFAPEIVFSQSDEVTASFLRGLFHADGTCAKFIRKNRTTIKLVTISERLAFDVQHLLLRFGINSAVTMNQNKIGGYRTKTSSIWTVIIGDKVNISLFLNKIGFLGKKQENALETITEKLGNGARFDRMPLEINNYISMKKHELGLSHSQIGWREQGKKMSRETAVKIGRKLNDDFLTDFGSSEIIWDEIKSIEFDSKSTTFDLTVGELHNFCVDGFVTHNSGAIEQDADVVMLLYRQSYYNRLPDAITAKAGPSRMQEMGLDEPANDEDAEIIFAKFRQGQKGTVHLRFDGARQRFS